MMQKHFLIYGHSGSYNHGAEALARTTIALLRQRVPGCKITLSTHFADQDREFGLIADEYVERNQTGNNFEEIYAPTIEKITSDTICIHSGGDNYCYKNWQRWAAIHLAAIKRGAKSVLWSCSIDPDLMDNEMLGALRTHHLITARECVTYDTLLAHGLQNVVKVSDMAFALEPEPIDFELKNYVVLNLSPLVVKRNPLVQAAYQNLLDYVVKETDLSIALVPHVLQPADNDCYALRLLDFNNSSRVMFASDKLTAGQYKGIIGRSRFCAAARTHAAIAAYSSCVPVLAVGYSAKAQGIAQDLEMSDYVIEVGKIETGMELVRLFKAMVANESSIKASLKEIMPSYKQNVASEEVLKLGGLL